MSWVAGARSWEESRLSFNCGGYLLMLCGERKRTLFHTDKVQIKRGCIALAGCQQLRLQLFVCAVLLPCFNPAAGATCKSPEGIFCPLLLVPHMSWSTSWRQGKDVCAFFFFFLLILAYQVPAPRILEFNSLPGLELGVILCFFISSRLVETIVMLVFCCCFFSFTY